MKRPLVAVALLYGAGVVLGHFLEAPSVHAFIAALSLTVLALWTDRLRPLLIPPALFLFGWLNMTTRTAVVSPQDLRTILANPAEEVVVRGRIVDSPSERIFLRKGMEISHTLADLEIDEVQLRNRPWQSAAGHVMSRTAGVLPPQFIVGQKIEVTGVALAPQPPIAPGVFDYAGYLHSRGIYYDLKVGSGADWKILGTPAARSVADRFRTWAQGTLARGLPETDESLRLQWAMLLGWQTALTAEVSEPFMRSGTMHIFAISGLHIALIAGIFLALLRAVTLPRFVCGLIVVPIIWFYTCATGWQASAIRSTVMMSVIIGGWMLKRPTDLLNSLAAAASIILVWQPEQLFQASFQLSFFVVLSIALLSPPIQNLKTRLFALESMLPFELRPRWQRLGIKTAGLLWSSLATSLAAFLGSMPLIAYYFHLFTPGSLIANLVVVPVSSLALMSGLGALITGDLIPPLTESFNNAGWFFMRSMIWLSESAAKAPASWIYVRAPGLLFFIMYYGALVVACLGWLSHKLARWVFISCAIVLGAIAYVHWQRARAAHELTILPLSGGHAVFAQPAQGAPPLLIDSGDRRAVQFTLKAFLQAQGVNQIGRLLLTYGSARQNGGAALLGELFPPRDVFISPIPFRSNIYREAVSELESRSRVRRCATNGFVLPSWTVLHPDSSERLAAAEDNAVVMLGVFDGARVLLVSDLGRAGQNAVFSRHPNLRADIVISGLPEKGEPVATPWLQKLRPKLIVIADSDFPATRRASTELLQRLRRTGAVVMSTRETGAVTLQFRNRSWRAITARPLTGSESALEMDDPGVPDE
jgi:ComEC/Rec2-related protein